jgi:hypothetical protein
MTMSFHATLRNNMLDQISARAGTSAILRIMSGTPGNIAAADGQVLAPLTCSAAAFAGAASNGVLTINSISTQSSASFNGTATWFRVYASNGSTLVLQGSVSSQQAGTGDLQLDNTTIVAGGTVAITGQSTITAGNP